MNAPIHRHGGPATAPATDARTQEATAALRALRNVTLDDILGAACLCAVAVFGWPAIALLSELVR